MYIHETLDYHLTKCVIPKGGVMDKDIPRYIKKYIECRCCNGSGSCTMSQTAAQIKCPYCEDGYKPIFEEEHKLEVE